MFDVVVDVGVIGSVVVGVSILCISCIFKYDRSNVDWVCMSGRFQVQMVLRSLCVIRRSVLVRGSDELMS